LFFYFEFDFTNLSSAMKFRKTTRVVVDDNNKGLIIIKKNTETLVWPWSTNDETNNSGCNKETYVRTRKACYSSGSRGYFSTELEAQFKDDVGDQSSHQLWETNMEPDNSDQWRVTPTVWLCMLFTYDMYFFNYFSKKTKL